MMGERVLHVLLNDQPVGRLALDAQERCEFRVLESYKQSYPRPVLGQCFLDDLDRVHTSRSRVPPWFSNLLPEGPLREMIARRAGVSTVREFHLLRHLGEDLPGAVRLLSEGEMLPPEADGDAPIRQEDNAGPWRFSLAGVQLKFSARRGERGLTIPASGQGGDWILKLPDARLPGVPRTEWATMNWAKASGIRVPEMALIDLADVEGLPDAFAHGSERQAFAIRRFDRPAPGKRIQVEDMAQVLGLYPEQKYERCNYETLARILFVLSGREALDEFLLRLLFVIASGNGDAHLKNWSLIYPDGLKAELSPAYDLVSTIQYMPDETLALNLGKSKRWQTISRETFQRLARKIQADEGWITGRVEWHLERIFSAWRESEDNFGFDAAAVRRLLNHWTGIPLLGGYS